jgi:hypothetical protein
VVELSKEEALRVLEAGEAAGARTGSGGSKAQAFYNPHWLGAATGPGIGAGTGMAGPGGGGGSGSALAGGGISLAGGEGSGHLEAQRLFFSRLLDVARVFLFNSGVAGAEKIKELVAR